MGLRETFCKIFQCQDYTVLRDTVNKIDADLTALAAVVAGIASQFPVVATLPPDVLAGLEAKMDLMLKNASTLWMEDVTVPDTIGNEFVIPVKVKLDATQQISAFGFGSGSAAPPLPGLLFDDAVLEFVGVEAGFATQTWGANVAGNEINPGEVIFGGYGGAASPVDGEGIHEIARLRFRVLSVPIQTFVTLQNAMDDLVGFAPAVFTAKVTFEVPTT